MGKALRDFQQKFAVDELIVTTATRDFSKRIRSFELLREALEEQGLLEHVETANVAESVI
ncbi:hypothetical protein D3C75_1376730 [compost metagenome]